MNMNYIPFLANLNEHTDKILSALIQIDSHITSNLIEGGFETRRAKSQGLWCFMLLPSIMTVHSILFDVSITYKLAAFTSVGLACYCLLFMVFLTISCMVLTANLRGGCLPSGLVSCFLVYTFTEQSLFFSAFFTLPAMYLLSYMLRMLLSCPKTFTIGEAMIVSQGFVILIVVSACAMVSLAEEPEFADKINITVLSTVGLIVTALSNLKSEHQNVTALMSIFAIGIIVELAQLLLLGLDCIPRLIFFIFFTRRIQLIAAWLFLVLGAIVLLVLRARKQEITRVTTSMRKSFHLLAALVFTSGIVIDLSLIKLAAGCGFGLVILLETLRKSNIECVSRPLQAAFDAYSDEKDRGSFAMTPLYLFAGLAAPLWLVPPQAPTLDRLAGVLSIGIGDSAASWFGSRYGSNKWPGNNRTFEGTLFSILSQIMFVYALCILDLVQEPFALLRTALAAVANALVEARTEQIDNLILPLVALLAFQSTDIISKILELLQIL